MAGSAIVGLLKVLLTADTAEFDSAMKRVSGSANAWAKDLGSIGRQATQVGATLTKALTLPIVGIGVASVKAAADFESAFAGVRKTVDATEPEFAQLAQGLRDMAKEIPTSVTELTAVAEAAGQLGIKKDDIIQFTRTMADLGVTTNLTADAAATATAQIQNIFGAAGKDVDRFGATLVALGNAGASTEKDIIEMSLRIAGAGHVVGLTQAQVLSFASALSSVGINAEAGGSAISRVFLKINDAVASGGAKLEEFARVAGMSGAAYKQAFETDAAGATVAFIEGLARLKASGENINATLEGVVGKNIILKDTLLRAAGAGQLLREQIVLGDKAWKENSALTTEAAERYKTLESQLKTVWNQIKDVGITLGTSLLPLLKDMVSAIAPLIAIVGALASGFASLPEPIRLVVMGVLALAAAVGPALYVFGSLTTGLATLVGAFGAKGIATRALTALYPPLAAGMLSASVAARALLVSLGPLAAAITAVWAAWKVGNIESVRDSIASWALSSDFAGAGLVRLALGLDKMTIAEAKAALEAMKAAESAKSQAIAIQDVGQKAGAAAPKVDGLAKSTGKSKEEMKEADKAAKKFAESLKDLGGANAIAGAEEVVKQLHAMNGPLNVLPEKLKQMADRLKEGAQAALMMGNVKLADQYMLLAKTLDPLVWFQQRYNVTIGEYIRQADMAETASAALWEQFYRLAGMTQTIAPLLKSTLDLDKLWVGLKVPVKSAMESGQTLGEALKEGLSKSLATLPNLLTQAFTGGGGIRGALKALAVQIGTEFGKVMAAEISKAIGSKGGIDWGNVLGSLPLAGMTIAIELALAAPEDVKNWVGVMDVLAKLEKQYGSVEAAEKALGKTFKEIIKLGREAALAFIHEALTHENAIAEVQQQIVDLQGELGTANSALDGLLSNAASLGYNFDREGNLVSVSFDKMKGSAEKFGVDVGSLGPKFKGQQLAATAKDIVDAFELMANGGADVGGILFGMQDEISDLVNAAKKSGVELPAQMEPWIRELLRAGLLVDDNGEKLTDLTGIKFGAPVESEFDKVSRAIGETVLAIKELMLKIDDLINKILSIPDKTYKITGEHVTTGEPPVVGQPGEGESGPASPTGAFPSVAGALSGGFGRGAFSGATSALRSAMDSLSSFSPASMASGLTPAFAGAAVPAGGAVNHTYQFHFEIHAIDGADVEQVTRSKIMPAIRRDLSNNTGGARTGFKNDLGI